MLKKVLYSVLLSAVISHAAVKELIPNLTSNDFDTQTKARLDLLAVCSNAGRPGAEAERNAVCLEICEVLKKNQPVMTVIRPMINNLERIGGEESVPTLIKYLSYKDEEVRDDARRALSVNPSAAVGQALGAQLKMRKIRSAKETAGLIQALGERREAGASRLIADYVGNRDNLIFISAVKALGRLNEDEGIRALATQRSKEKGFRQIQIYAALFSTQRKIVLQKLYAESEPEAVRSVALLGLLLQGETGLAANAMASGDPALQIAVIEAALQGKDATVYDAVAAHIENLPPHLQLQALGALEFSANPVYAKAVDPLLNSSDLAVQNAASQALDRIGTLSSVSSLLTSGTPESLRALGLLGADGVDKALEEEAAKKGDDARRARAIDALAIRGRDNLIPSFFIYAAEDGKETSKSAVKAIGTLGDLSNLEPLTRLMTDKESDPLSRDILKAIVEIVRRSNDPAEAVKILVAQIDGASPRSQANILQALVQTESRNALKPLTDACRSSDANLQKSAVKLLGGWQGDDALKPMIELARDDSMSMANHVVLMRGVSRILAGQKQNNFNKELAQDALEACRRPEEKQMIRDVIAEKEK